MAPPSIAAKSPAATAGAGKNVVLGRSPDMISAHHSRGGGLRSATVDGFGPGGDAGGNAMGERGHTCGSDVARRVADLVSQAEERLQDFDLEVQKERVVSESKRQRIEALVLSAMEVSERNASEENLEALEQAVDVAQKARLLPELRVKARKYLEKHRSCSNKTHFHERLLQRLARQLDALAPEDAESSVSTATSSAVEGVREARRRHHAQQLTKQLGQALEDAPRHGVDQDTIVQAQASLAAFRKRRRAEAKVETKLRELSHKDDVEELGEQLEQARDRADLGPGAQRALFDIEDKVFQKTQHKQHQEWLEHELKVAAQSSDKWRLEQLCYQARTLNLTVPPWVQRLVNRATEAARPHPKAEKTGKDPKERLLAFAQRAEEKAAETLAEFDPDEPTLDDLIDAKKAVEIAKHKKVNAESLHVLEHSLAQIEMTFGPRFEVEDKLRGVFRLAEKRSPDCFNDETELTDPTEVDTLKVLLKEAEKWQCDPDIVENAEGLLHRSLEAIAIRHGADVVLRRALARPLKSEVELGLLQDAIASGRRCGANTLQADRELARLRSDQVQREAAEAELREASKGLGLRGRRRLEEAISHAKSIGVCPATVKVASDRLSRLIDHEEKCAHAAGNIRRTLPAMRREPWKFQQIMEMVKPLHPMTPELERLVQQCKDFLRTYLGAVQEQKEIAGELRSLLDHLKGRKLGTSHEDTDRLQELVHRGRGLLQKPPPPSIASGGSERFAGGGGLGAQELPSALSESLLNEAEKQLKGLRRERCQRLAAEKRLQLAMKDRVHDEIDKSMRQVRALGQLFADGSSAGVTKPANEQHSARLMDAAHTMLGQLGESAAKKRSALAALQERLNFPAAGSLPNAVVISGPGVPEVAALRGEADWLSDVTNLIQEARQLGVPSSMLEQAKRQVHTRQREYRERVCACEDLQRSLVQPNASAQDILMKLRKVQRLAGDPVSVASARGPREV